MKDIIKEWREYLTEKKKPAKNLIPPGYVEYEVEKGDPTTIKDLIDKFNLPYDTTTPQGKWNYNNLQMEIAMEYGRGTRMAARPTPMPGQEEAPGFDRGTDIKELAIPVGTKVIIPFTSNLKRSTPTDKLVQKIKDKNFDPAKDVESFFNNLTKQAKKIRFGFTHPGQPTLTRASNARGRSTELVKLGPANAKIDKVLAWLINNMRFHASLLGIIDHNSKYFMPSGFYSGFRNDNIQKKKFKNKFNKLNQALKNGATSISFKGTKLTIKDGKFYLNKKPVTNLAYAIHLVARKEVARPKERITLTAFNDDTYKIYSGDPKHGTGRTVDFFLQGDEGRLDGDRNDAARNSNTGLFLKYYGPMYGLVNYGGESWHWELNKANRDFFADMMAKNQSPLKNAIETMSKFDKKTNV
jgi:hypothetical protein